MAEDPSLVMSKDPPKPEHLRLSETLTQALKEENQFESTEETNQRHAVLERLRKVLNRLIQVVGEQQELPQGILSEAKGKVFTYGSFELGVYGPGSDIDTLMIGPKYVSRQHFFDEVPELLKKEFKPEEITKANAIRDAAVPIIKTELCGIDIDLIFCSLPVTAVPDDISDTNLLRGLPETDLRCMNGIRVTRRILDLVPQTKPFRATLRAVKLWAQRRALYGNTYGFPGGVAYAMMVARTCQLYPRAASAHLIRKFFFVMKQWNWPSPLYLQQRESAELQLREWDPHVWPSDRRHSMPLITPAYPRQNAFHTAGPSTMKILMQEMQRADAIVDTIETKGRPWKDLFQKHTFFTDSYKHYISVITASKKKDEQDRWSGLVEAKIRHLVAGIEGSDATSVDLVQAFNKGFKREHYCRNPDAVEVTLEGSLDNQIRETKTEVTQQGTEIAVQASAETDADSKDVPMANGTSTLESDGPETIYTTTWYLGIGLKKGANSLDISRPIQTFKDHCLAWEPYNADMHSIRIKHLRNYDLPPDVFEQGEVRPTKKKAKAAAKTAETANKKRSVSNAGLDDNNDPAKRRQSVNGSSATATPNGTTTTNGVAG